MAQIIKHRRGLIGGVKNLTARNGELIIASGSISDLAGPFVFIGSPNAIDEGVAGAFNSISKLYTGTAAPTITAATYGSALDGTPYYASGNKSLYILNNSNVGNTQIDLTGNIEGNTISGVTITKLNSTNVTASFVSASFKGDGTGIYNIPSSGVTGLELNKIYQGTVTASITEANGFSVNTNSAISGALTVSGAFNMDFSAPSNAGYSLASMANFTRQGGNGGANIRVGQGDAGYGIFGQDNNMSIVMGSVANTDGEKPVRIYTNASNDGLTLTGERLSIDSNGLNVTGALKVTENATLEKDLLVSGAAKISGSASVTGSLNVKGDTTLEKDLYVSGNIYQTGSFFTQGDIILSGSINIGDNLTGDTINFGGEISSSIIPAVNNSFDLGGPLNAWNDLYVSGTAYIENINLASISVNSLALPGDLTVSGTTILSGSVYVEDLIEKRLVVAGANGLLTNYSGLTFDNGNLNVSGAIEVTNIQGTGSLYLQADKGDSRYFEIYNTGVSDTHIKSSGGLSFFGDDTNYLKIDDNTGTATIVGVNGVSVSSSLKVTGSVNVNGDTSLTGSVNISGSTAMTGSVNVNGGTSITGSVNISGSSTITGSLIVSDASGVFNSSLISYNSDLTLSGGSDINMEDGAHLYFNSQNGDIYYNTAGGLNELTLYNDANDSIRLDNSVNVSDDIHVTGSVRTDSVSGRTNSTNALHLNGGNDSAPDVELSSNGQISLYSEGAGSNYAINMTGSVYLNDNLNVTGSSTFLGGVTFLSGVTFNTSPTITGLTDNRIVLAGSGGQLEDDANFTFDGTTFKIGNGDFEVDLSGNTRTSGSLLVKSGIEVTGSFKLNDSATNFKILGNGFGQTYLQSLDGAMALQPGYGGVEVLGDNATLKVNGSITGYNNLQISGNTSLTGSLTVASGSATMLGGDLYVSGNLQVLGSSTNVSIESSTVNIGDNIIQVNAYSPFDRFAGLSAYDSGSSGASGSFLWDSTNDYWLIVNTNGASSKVVGTTTSTGGTGTEISLTSGVFPIASASNTIEDSLLTFSGTTLAFNTNKFTVDSGTGATAISGNLTLSYSGGTDGGTKTSRVTFRNSSNVLGFVSATETTNELDGILGYNHSSGVLEFSTLIDGGTY